MIEGKQSQLQQVKAIMLSKEWVTLYDMAKLIGASDAGISARVRDLKKPQYGRHIIVKRKKSANTYEYRLIV